MLPLGMGWIPPSHHNHGPLSPFSFLPFTFLPFSDGGRIFRGRVVPGILDRTPPSFLEHPPIDPSSMGHHNRRVGQRRSIAHGDNPKDRRRDPSAKEPNHTKRSTRRKVGIRKEKKQLRCRRVVVVHSEIRASRQAGASVVETRRRPTENPRDERGRNKRCIVRRSGQDVQVVGRKNALSLFPSVLRRKQQNKRPKQGCERRSR